MISDLGGECAAGGCIRKDGLPNSEVDGFSIARILAPVAEAGFRNRYMIGGRSCLGVRGWGLGGVN
jgi:hypothetical protein